MSRFIRERYKGFESYKPGEQPKDMEDVKLNKNESPFPPAPAVLNVLKQADMDFLPEAIEDALADEELLSALAVSDFAGGNSNILHELHRFLV